ncbi:hypothetical protein [Streptomyces sp. NPDC007991]|uniref:hypothetical protein n=1 Tax=Streptomyces sp. NPDC007991 TaxID=3364803 RepID=UPI0036E45DFF
MVQEDNPQDGAAARLHQLAEYFREHPVEGPVEGHSASRSAPAPLSLATLDHIQASVNEVIAHTRGANPEAGPAPSRADAVYDWCREHTEHADETVQQRRDTIEYRQYLEHALRAGDKLVIRKQRCPECRTWGLMWQRDMQAALCTNTDCVDNDGFSHTFTLARLAHEHVTARTKIRQARTT